MKWNYYNDNDPKNCAWARELIRRGLVPDGEVDCRPIQEVQPDDVRNFVQCHWFCGILGWSYALRLAGWPDDRPVWTASLPCQSFSSSGKQKGFGDDRGNLWFPFLGNVRKHKPVVIFGEQVKAAIGHGWLDRVFTDLEAESYTCGAAVLGAHSVGAPHIRQRIYWVAMDDARGEDVSGLDQERISVRRFQSASLPVNRVSGLQPWIHLKPDSIASGTIDGVQRPVGIVRGFGNAIVPQVAEVFIRSALEALDETF